MTTTMKISRLNNTASTLDPSSSALPLLGWHVDFSTGLVASL